MGSIERSGEVSRRKFLRIGAAATTGVFGAELGIDAVSLINAKEIHYPFYCVEMRGLQDPLWVVQFSDTHPGDGGGIDHVDEKVCQKLAFDVAERLTNIGAEEGRTILTKTGPEETLFNTSTLYATPIRITPG